MIKAYSQRLLPPYSGQVQIAESDRARALTVDGESWEFQFLKSSNSRFARPGEQSDRSFRRAAYIQHDELGNIAARSLSGETGTDERILELAEYLASATLPFPAADVFEYWLLDKKDGIPLALIFSCTEASYMENYPERPEWTALPAAIMPIDATDREKERSDSPVNYRVESLVTQRAGTSPRARWFARKAGDIDEFPAFMLREDWEDPADQELCQRYLQRQSTRLLMLHGLLHDDRRRMELAARKHVFEVERFFPLYPEIADEKIISAIRVEAQLRKSTENQSESLLDRRDGILYI